ncbi:YaaC family protein [Cytobacillus purgationiresistens]|uniref:YaaC-like protein n=1 Tax=Cytobacillus purgationiresistens TaxID=863449 RepID=A0ABU0ASX9_9BACI|nr:YaaC family protein [Cytobacillus purgationiresistens]MDQ0273877.1 hypothetical protein [Cytobacillus purgationiresistens]
MNNKFHHFQSYLYFYSADTTKAFLKHSYQNEHIENADQKSFANTYPFIYYLEHGQIYYEQADKAPLMIKPILYFYGLVHLIKACILTVDPNYPETTSVLAHGVSARKRKKQQYLFVTDEVKFQKSGLFPYMAERLFHMKHLEGEKVQMADLLKQMPELSTLFHLTEKKQTFVEVNKCGNSFSIPLSVLDRYHMTESRFFDYLKSKINIETSNHSLNKESLQFDAEDSQLFNLRLLKYHQKEESFYIPIGKNDFNHYPELLAHYLLLYNLSMIARYETEWWNELIKMMPNNDFPFIKSFLDITSTKGPYLVYQYLMSRRD